ncbi:MAG TPA: L,D-transpeptidase family protein, partial [Candidatus Omnitrophota bacterium]|nr:L,D-transpeptidase family protein [Candidatus Omnitrophota bacterium]
MKKVLIGAGALLSILVVVFFVSKVFKSSPEGAAQVQAYGNYDDALKEAGNLEARGELLPAQELYKKIIMEHASEPKIEDVQKKLEDLNMRIVLSAVNVPGQTAIREIKEGDSLSMIADEFHTTSEMIKRQNGLKSDVIRLGQRLRVWTGRFNVLVDKSQNILILKSDSDVVKTFRVSTGKDNITPVGTFKIVNKLKDPSWTHEGQLIPAGDKRNILGTRWMGFDIPGYGIHGTTIPESIGTQATAGCVRMLNNEVELLYDFLPIGTEVV